MSDGTCRVGRRYPIRSMSMRALGLRRTARFSLLTPSTTVRRV